ncbi:hypothetical protein BFW01_g12720 [Lasiodiplodia theobromae]|nr:hypothetical protein BFW01_g12720 [Lasiodiplodia theobromae]
MPPEFLPSPDLSPTPPPSPPLETAYTAALPHNATHSLLHRLPLELLTHLTTHYLPSTADILALRATSNDFRHNPLIPAPFSSSPPSSPTTTPPSFSFSSSHRAALAAAKDFRHRLARDDTTRAFLASCAAERAALNFRPWPVLDERPRACAGCVAAHPRHWFSAAQLRVDPELRRCRGTEGVGGTPVCAHEVVGWHRMRALREEAKRKTPGDFRWGCGREGCRAELVFPRKWRELVWARRRVVVARGVGAGVGEGMGVTREVVWGWLREAEEADGVFVCRHVKLGVPESFESEWVGLGRRWEDVGGGKISIHRCRVRTCNVKVSLSWTRVETGDRDGPVVELDILRYFGELESPIEEQWCAQLQHAEER